MVTRSVFVNCCPKRIYWKIPPIWNLYQCNSRTFTRVSLRFISGLKSVRSFSETCKKLYVLYIVSMNKAISIMLCTFQFNELFYKCTFFVHFFSLISSKLHLQNDLKTIQNSERNLSFKLLTDIVGIKIKSDNFLKIW